jgi:hypothetical protein
MPLATYPANRVHSKGVHSQGDNLDYYIIKLLFGALMRCCHVWVSAQQPSTGHRCWTSGSRPPVTLPVPGLRLPTSGYRWPSPEDLQCLVLPTKTWRLFLSGERRPKLARARYGCPSLVAKGSPPSSHSKVRFNPDNPIL